jgi:DeoR family transcriptional regulator, aga operon transcriptional repressor
MAVAKVMRLLGEERRRKILEYLEKDGRVTVDKLVKSLAVSAVTVRGDLDALSRAGSLVRSHGGAVRPLNPVQDYPVEMKASIHHAEKERIGRAAVKLIQPGQTIILDSGSTAAEVAASIKALKLTNLTVITNALNIARSLADTPNISLIMIGGILRQVSGSFVGPQAEQMLRELHADHFFLAVDGFDPQIGPSTPDILEAQLNGLMMEVSKEVTVIADASKFGRRSLSVIGDIGRVHRVITDRRVQDDMAVALRDRGIEVILV